MRLGLSAVVPLQLYPVSPIRGLITDLKVTCIPAVLFLIMLLKQQPRPCQHGGFHRVRSPAWSRRGCCAVGVWPVLFEGMERSLASGQGGSRLGASSGEERGGWPAWQSREYLARGRAPPA